VPWGAGRLWAAGGKGYGAFAQARCGERQGPACARAARGAGPGAARPAGAPFGNWPRPPPCTSPCSLRNQLLVATDWIRTKVFGRDISRF
jgi:hypothetical protein